MSSGAKFVTFRYQSQIGLTHHQGVAAGWLGEGQESEEFIAYHQNITKLHP